MRAVQIHAHGGIDQLRYEKSDDPEITSECDVIVKLRAAGVSPSDISARQGLISPSTKFPHILGTDGAGIVVAVGAQVTNLKSGDAVCLFPANGCGRCQLCGTDREFMCAGLRVLGQQETGTYAEYMRVPERNCFPVPAELAFEEAAALPVDFVTAWRMLMTNAALKPGESLLIRGIGGGVATAALQLAAAIRTRVIVTADDDDKLAAAKRLGAEHAIHDGRADAAKEVRELTGKRGVDVVVDCVGGYGWVASLAALAKGGRLVTSGASAGANPLTDVRRIFWNNLKVFGSTLGTREEFKQVLDFIEATGTKPVIDRMFSLKEAGQAHQRLAEGRQFGKIILRMVG